jgi:hypothetical protein
MLRSEKDHEYSYSWRIEATTPSTIRSVWPAAPVPDFALAGHCSSSPSSKGRASIYLLGCTFRTP